MLETCRQPLIASLLYAGHYVTLRPHPMTQRHNKRLIDTIYNRFSSYDRFRRDEDMVSQETLHSDNVMVSDWSGAALEFSFGLERPVLFVDVPRKINNPDYGNIGIEPLEAIVRTELGTILDPAWIQETPKEIAKLCGEGEKLTERIRNAREKWVFNLGASASVGGDYIASLADSLSGVAQPTS